MAKTISELRNQSIQVRDASAAGENTATRVGTVLNDIVGHIEDYENTQSSNNSTQDAKIESVKTSLNAEIARAKTEESNLSTQIGTERTERQAAVSSEETARIQADNTEKTARMAADNTEQDARIKADNAEKTARENADIILRTMIQTEVSDREKAVADETARAKAAEQANTQAIADETARAKAAEQAETTRATTEEERLQGEIDNTNTSVETLDDKVNSNHDHLTDELARLDLTDAKIKVDLEAETARAKAAEEANADNITKNVQAISNETKRATAVETNISSEVSKKIDATNFNNQLQKKADKNEVTASIIALENKIGERTEIKGDVVNNPDEEDLTQQNNKLMLKNRVYEPLNYGGKGYKILRKNIVTINVPSATISVLSAPTTDGYISVIVDGVEIHIDVTTSDTVYDLCKRIATEIECNLNNFTVTYTDTTVELKGNYEFTISDVAISAVDTGAIFGSTINEKIHKKVNLLTQDMINQPNTIYEIRYDFDLNGEEVTIPECCMLKFEGGSIYGGVLYGTLINSHIKPEWFKSPCEQDYYKSFDVFKGLNNDIVFSNRTYLIGRPLTILNKNIIFTNNATLKLTRPVDTFIIWGQNEDDTVTSKGINMRGSGTIDGNFLANTVLSGTNLRRCKIEGINIKNGNSIIFNSTVNTGSVSVHNVTLSNDKPIIGSIGLNASSADSTYVRLVIINTSIGIAQNSQNNKFLDVHHWLSFKELWESSITIDAYKLRNTYISCEADSVRTFFKCSSDYMQANIIAPVHYRNEKIITDELVALYPPLLIDKNDYNNTYINIFGGNLRFLRCDYQIVNKDSLYDCILINNGTGNINQNTPDKLSILQSSFQPLENNFNLILNKNIGVGAFKVETTEDTKLYSKPMWWNGSMWIAADGYPISNKRVGLNSERPNPKENNIGLMYFSTSLKRPFFSDGEKYVDAEGFSLTSRRGSTNDRPSTLVATDNGKLYFDTSLKQTIMYLNGEWATLEGYPLIKYINDYSELPTSGITEGFRTLLKIGDRIVPIYYTGKQWVKSDGTLASFKHSGNTSERPNNIKEGECFFDTTLNKPIWWTGTEWIDALGTAVN